MNWKTLIKKEQLEDYYQEIMKTLDREYAMGVSPPRELVFKALNMTPFDDVKVVILGKEPSCGNLVSDGSSDVYESEVLAWAEPEVEPFSALANILKEVQSDLGSKKVFYSGKLDGWAKQGVLLLNRTLTMRKNRPESHEGIGWTTFTDNVIESIAHHKKHVVFMLWGDDNIKKKKMINTSRYGATNLVLTASHPSPFSAKKSFVGCKHFSKANEYLKANGIQEIDWLKHI